MALSSETLNSAFKTSTLRNGHFKVAVWKIEPHLVAAEVGKKNLGVSYGYALAAASVYNFTFDLSYPARQLMHPNGSWAGTMADLHYRRIDMTLMLSPTAERLDAVSFSTHALELRLIFLTALPLARVNWRAFEVPFSKTVWFVTFFTLCCMALCIYVRLRCAPTACKAHEVYQTTFTLSYCPLLMQAVKIPSEIRFFTLMWIVMSFILINFYCSEILSAITIPTKEHIPEDFEELGFPGMRFKRCAGQEKSLYFLGLYWIPSGG
ncbi:unnamed protein product [Allacma fusca]|uniref:Uncharacterized protein n=1 Tax=Allacma fusca TaxID=39272 RepID=A0A8J2KPE8_9HEXA|nr:unnamed protein product [Allacma fusca]